jgi:hypothetical protein
MAAGDDLIEAQKQLSSEGNAVTSGADLLASSESGTAGLRAEQQLVNSVCCMQHRELSRPSARSAAVLHPELNNNKMAADDLIAAQKQLSSAGNGVAAGADPTTTRQLVSSTAPPVRPEQTRNRLRASPSCSGGVGGWCA